MSTILDTIKNLDLKNPEMLPIESWEEQLRFLGVKIINVGDFSELLLRLAFNMLVLFILVHFIYSKNRSRKAFYFSYLSVGAIVFLLCFLLSNVKLELAFALGLFAIFGILRYRTNTIPIIEMTYLFVVIGISVINALSNKKVSYTELLFTNTAVVAGLWILEKKLLLTTEKSISLIYDKLDNIRLKNYELLLEELRERSGLNLTRYKIVKIDFSKSVAEIKLYFSPNSKHN